MDLGGLTTLALVALVFFLFFQLPWSKGHKVKLPPGPTPLPLLGNMLQMGSKNIVTFLDKVAEKYGPVSTIHMGTQRVVVLHGYETVKEALIDQGDKSVHREAPPIFKIISKGNDRIQPLKFT